MYKISYIGDGVQYRFRFAFPFFQNADVRVALDGKTLDAAQYNVAANDAMDGGIITLGGAPAAGVRVDIFRQIELSRVIDYQPAAHINPEHLNTDFNYLTEAIRDIRALDADLSEWTANHQGIVSMIEMTRDLIQEKIGENVMGLYRNLLNVMAGALPQLINDYGSITDTPDIDNSDDYGVL